MEKEIKKLKEEYPNSCAWCSEFEYFHGLKQCGLKHKVVPNPVFTAWSRPNWCPKKNESVSIVEPVQEGDE